MSDSSRTQELLAQEGLESIGQKLFNTINDLTGKPQSARRWIWELLQNAKDVIVEKGKIEIELTESYVSFSHNGSPFLHDHLLAILSQRSTKPPSYTDEAKQSFFERLFSDQEISSSEAKEFLDTTGKFGTGFMTTYLLSKKVHLESIYRSNGNAKNFTLPLDREASTPDEMKEKVKNSFATFTELERDEFSESKTINSQEAQNCVTKFIYYFDADGKKVAEHGINDMHNAIPFVFTFVSRLESVQIAEYGKSTTYIRLPPETVDALTIERIEKKNTTGKDVIEIARLSARFESITIALAVQHINEKKYRLLPPDENTPRQFISFPLVGSESFPFPVIIHSPLFSPDDLRSHVFLNLTNHHSFDKKVQLNRAIFEKSLTLYNELLRIASENKWEKLHFLAKSDLPIEITDDWYKNDIQGKIRKEILDIELVVTESGKRIKPRDAKFPIYKESKLEEFWHLCKFLFGDQIPNKEDVPIWKKIIAANSKDWLGIDFDLDLEKLLLMIQNSATLTAFNQAYFNNETKAFTALNEILQFTENEDKELLNRKESPLKVFPNQEFNSPFVEKQKLSRDVSVPKPLKNVLRSTGENWYDKLVRDEIEIFERESKFTIKLVSDKLREKIEKSFTNKLTAPEKQQLDTGLFELAGFASQGNKSEIEVLNKYLKRFFPGISDTVQEMPGVEDFDWKPFQIWAIKTILKKISSFQNLGNLALHLMGQQYPELKNEYSKEDENLMYKVDTELNGIIQFILKFDKNLLSEYAIIPNQLNNFCKYNNEIFNDANIPKELKKIIADFGKDCRGSLLHGGVTVTLQGEPRNLKWICSQLDDIAIKEQDNHLLKQPIRELDKWISKNKGAITGMDELFKSFYRKRSGIVLNTYSLEERNQFDDIQQSGLSSEFAAMTKLGATSETIRNVTKLLQSNPELNADKITDIASLLKQHPDLTSDKIEQLVELSKGWNPEMTYSPDEIQKRKNFENGWKGEAFVFKQLQRKNFVVEWKNKSNVDTDNSIIDFSGERHFIADQFEKYDIVAKLTNGKTFYIQVKSTTTDISDSDQIAMPISIREWNFVFETKENDAYYLARVFNVNEKPNVYFMKLERPEEL